MIKLIFPMIVVWSMIGCAAALVPSTSNPEKKLDWAYELMDKGRPLPAKKLILEAQDIYRKKNDSMNIARSYSALGDLYRSGKTQGNLKLPNINEAKVNYQQAIAIYKEQKQPKWVALNMWPMATMQYYSGDKATACKTLDQARKQFALGSSQEQANFEKSGAFTMATLDKESKLFKCKQ